MPFYETVFIVRQDASTQQVESLTDQFSSVVTERNGKVSKREGWGLRNLSYKIKKNRKGHYVLLNIDAMPEAVLEMERLMHLSEDILRYLTIKVDRLDDQPSPILQSRGGRDNERERNRFARGDRDGGRFSSREKTSRERSGSGNEEHLASGSHYKGLKEGDT